MKEIFINTNSLWMCNSYFDKISAHLELMNSWKDDPEMVEKFPFILEKQFTLTDALNDLLMKGGL